jgi:hypothetical protein
MECKYKHPVGIIALDYKCNAHLWAIKDHS